MEITREEMQTMINAAVERNLEERRNNRTRISKLLDKYDEEFEKFNYTEHLKSYRWDGEPISRDVEHFHAHKVRSAIMTLMRAHFQVDNINRLSVDKDDEISEFVESILQRAKPKEA